MVATNRPATQDEIYGGVAKHSSEDSGIKVDDMVVIKCSLKDDEACGVLLREIGILECQHGGLHCPVIGFHKLRSHFSYGPLRVLFLSLQTVDGGSGGGGIGNSSGMMVVVMVVVVMLWYCG